MLAALFAPGSRALADDPPVQPATDHARVVGSLGFGWFGVSEIPLGALDELAAAPAIGVRWWISESVGLDLGLGIGILHDSGSTQQDGMLVLDSAGPTSVALLAHVGVPFALHAGRHYTLIAVPELNVGFATSKTMTDRAGDAETAATVEETGTRLDIGGRVGAEIQFGFMGIPELALEASIGLFFTHFTSSRDAGGSSSSASSTQLTTAVFDNPWDFFRSTVAARYYF